MPSKTRTPAMKKADNEYQARPEQVKKRVERNKARRHALKAGEVKKGDGKDVHHKKPLDAGGTNSKSNRSVTSEAKNRSWRKSKPKMYG